MASKTTEHKEGKALVKVVYYKSKTYSDGSHPFMVRITKDGKRKYVATGLTLHPDYWNEKKNEVRRSYPEPERENLLVDLGKWEKKYTKAANVLVAKKEQHDATSVAAKAIESLSEHRKVQLLAYIDELVTAMTSAQQVGNATVYRDLRNQLLKFIKDVYKKEDLPFENINVAFCNEWENCLRASGLTDITLSLRFRTLRAVCNKAIANGLAKAKYYPFARNAAERHKFSVGKFDVSTTKRAITREEIRKLEAFSPETERLLLAKNVFLFSYYCGGINFVDLAQLHWQNITTDSEGIQRLNYTRQKTGGKFSIRVLSPASAIITSYKPFTFCSKGCYIFPILNPQKHQNATQIKNRLHKILGQVNEDLKTLGEKVKIDTPLTTYVARHSFATNLKRFGVSTAVISEAMGHKSEAVTAVYLDSFASETIDSAFEHLL